jgi:hypothetical protein
MGGESADTGQYGMGEKASNAGTSDHAPAEMVSSGMARWSR